MVSFLFKSNLLLLPRQARIFESFSLAYCSWESEWVQLGQAGPQI